MHSTVEAVVLLGRFEKEEAISYLCEKCIHEKPLNGTAAEAIWLPYRNRIEEMAEREAKAPGRQVLDTKEAYHRKRFLEKHRARKGTDISDVVKINPMDLVVRQLEIIADRAEKYKATHKTPAEWNALFLPFDPPEPRLTISRGFVCFDGLPRSEFDIPLPHSEFVFGLTPQGLQLAQTGRHASVTAYEGRMVLWAGYHRSFARMACMAPEAIERSVLYALNSTPLGSPPSVAPGTQLLRDLRGPRAPLLRDFFDERFFIRVKLRKKRYELQIRSSVVAIDDVS